MYNMHRWRYIYINTHICADITQDITVIKLKSNLHVIHNEGLMNTNIDDGQTVLNQGLGARILLEPRDHNLILK